MESNQSNNEEYDILQQKNELKKLEEKLENLERQRRQIEQLEQEGGEIQVDPNSCENQINYDEQKLDPDQFNLDSQELSHSQQEIHQTNTSSGNDFIIKKLKFIKNEIKECQTQIQSLKQSLEKYDYLDQQKNIEELKGDMELALKFKEQGAKEYGTGKFSEAIELFRESLSNAPMQDIDLRSKLNSNIGICFMNLKDYKEAINFFTDSLQENPLFHKAKVNRAKCYFLEENYERAMKDYEELNKTNPELVPQDMYKKAKVKHDEEFEKKKEEVMTNLKSFGNKILGNFGMSLDNFKLNPNGQGGYNVSYQN